MAKNYLKSIDEKMDVIIKSLNEGNKIVVSGSQEKDKSGNFIDNGDGIISDSTTGLMWDKNGSTEVMTYEKAVKYCENLNIGGYKDWRLPTLKELFGIADHTKRNSAIDPIFDCRSDWYWTSTPYAGGSGYAWMVYFGYGRASWSDRSSYLYVRPVRQY